jgi:hypothetical protein
MIAYVLAHPKEYDQENFPEATKEVYKKGVLVKLDTPVCNTAYCAAGHMVAQQFPERFKRLLKRQWREAGAVVWELEALKVLGIKPASDNPLNYYGYSNLFGPLSSWPEKFFNQYENAKGPKGRAKAFANLWNEFILVDGDLEKLDPTWHENRYGI